MKYAELVAAYLPWLAVIPVWRKVKKAEAKAEAFAQAQLRNILAVEKNNAVIAALRSVPWITTARKV